MYEEPSTFYVLLNSVGIMKTYSVSALDYYASFPISTQLHDHILYQIQQHVKWTPRVICKTKLIDIRMKVWVHKESYFPLKTSRETVKV